MKVLEIRMHFSETVMQYNPKKVLPFPGHPTFSPKLILPRVLRRGETTHAQRRRSAYCISRFSKYFLDRLHECHLSTSIWPCPAFTQIRQRSVPVSPLLLPAITPEKIRFTSLRYCHWVVSVTECGEVNPDHVLKCAGV